MNTTASAEEKIYPSREERETQISRIWRKNSMFRYLDHLSRYSEPEPGFKIRKKLNNSD